eukprot:CAMPEP_0181211636 /NCGR_PEP_ID=MMETSP1096-20121128/23904_1 /TAXON_ID=156174 ORGANISM="Chrysochromulina ericina, Strain CCMP281" /NCGR_SAMPLE_ID=MMETSP1096 /ASSEMBLY_ACC=CAM_ASM_000453 /LENGTH=82 /DNA_ID=CAMNT_0023303075 /DNA_START=649 /DNA_END=893 /DNA_ORIENTATION=+
MRCSGKGDASDCAARPVRELLRAHFLVGRLYLRPAARAAAGAAPAPMLNETGAASKETGAALPKLATAGAGAPPNPLMAAAG